MITQKQRVSALRGDPTILAANGIGCGKIQLQRASPRRKMTFNGLGSRRMPVRSGVGFDGCAGNRFSYDGSNVMHGKTAVVLLLGLLCGCVQPQPSGAVQSPAAPPPAAAQPAAAAAVPAARWVSIRAVSCARLLELSDEDRAAASMFYHGYQASRSGARNINVGGLGNLEALVLRYCTAYPDRPVVEAFKEVYALNR